MELGSKNIARNYLDDALSVCAEDKGNLSLARKRLLELERR